ncbi:fibroblast growth factor receptor 3 isoform X1, partial [Lates japonicus]
RGAAGTSPTAVPSHRWRRGNASSARPRSVRNRRVSAGVSAIRTQSPQITQPFFKHMRFNGIQMVSGGEYLDSFLRRQRPPFCWTACEQRMLSELGLAALRLTSSSRGMTALWCSLWLSFLLPLCVAPARLPTTQPTDSVSSETAFLEDYVLGMGDTLEMSCDLEDPSEPIVWFKDGIGLVPSNRTRLGQRMLRIINVSYEDSGVYLCRLAHSNALLSNYTIRVTDSLSSGDDEDYDEDPEDT